MTIAVGNLYYSKLAENLLKSFLMHNRGDIDFLLLTDNVDYFHSYNDITEIKIRYIDLSANNRSFTAKFSLFDYAFADENLFVDCDCLIYKELSFVFDYFKDKDFSAIGNNIISGEFFCNVSQILDQFNLKSLPKFVGSVYYFKKNSTAQKIFEEARRLQTRYDECGFVRLRDKENEEPLFAVSMGLYGSEPIPNDGIIKADLMYYKRVNCNVLNRYAETGSPNTSLTGGEIIPAKSQPAILHFNGSFSDSYLYECETYRLHHQHNRLMTGLVCACLKSSALIGQAIKYTLRPIYRLLVGYRPIGKSNRL